MLSTPFPVIELCLTLGVERSSYYQQRSRQARRNPRRDRLRARLVVLHERSRGSKEPAHWQPRYAVKATPLAVTRRPA